MRLRADAILAGASAAVGVRFYRTLDAHARAEMARLRHCTQTSRYGCQSKRACLRASQKLLRSNRRAKAFETNSSGVRTTRSRRCVVTDAA